MSNLLIGHPAPDFTLPAFPEERINLAALRGNGVALFFYPKDNTPG